MSKSRKAKSAPGTAVAAKPLTLADMMAALERNRDLVPTRLRDLRSAVKRVAALLSQDPRAVQLDLREISARLAGVNPVAAGMTAKRLANIRSDFLAALKASGLTTTASGSAKAPLSADWHELFDHLSGRRAHIGLSRLAHYASAEGITPKDVNDQVIARFIAAVREGSLHRQPNVLHRQVALIWNEAAQDARFGLRLVTVPSFRAPAKRVPWELLTATFRKDVEDYLSWCGNADPFAADARIRALAPGTLRLRRDQIHAAVTALVDSGVQPSAILSLANLVSTDNVKTILRRRLDAVGGQENTFNNAVGKTLIQMAHEWVKVEGPHLAEVKRLVGRLPVPLAGLTAKNKRFLRQFDDPAALCRLWDLPGRLWAEVKRESKPNFRTLAKAQAALGIAILCNAPLRPENLTILEFDTHLFVRAGAGAISSLEMPESEVKNGVPLEYDIPPNVAKMLIEYRDRIAPKVIGKRPSRLFVNVDGTPKAQATVAWLIGTYARRRAGIVLTPHQFRHLSAKVLLDDQPGSFEVVRQALGHKSLRNTRIYAGIDSRRAARHQQRLIERALAEQIPLRGRARGKPTKQPVRD
jgi:integrase